MTVVFLTSQVTGHNPRQNQVLKATEINILCIFLNTVNYTMEWSCIQRIHTGMPLYPLGFCSGPHWGYLKLWILGTTFER